jgi:uncharacterized membrane protein YcaP (DUF421 family)
MAIGPLAWLPDMWTLNVPLIEKILRPVLVYLALILMIRIFGKRELAQLNTFDLVVLLSISNTVQNAIIGNDNSLVGGLVGALALFSINWFTVRMLFRHPRLERVLEGTPTVLIRNGKLDRKALEKELLTESELRIAAHKQGFDSLDEVGECVLEPDGSLAMTHRPETLDTRRWEQVMATLQRMDRKLDEIGKRVD